MNILTFDIEEWFHCDFISDSSTWVKYESRIHQSMDRILQLLADKNRKGTFFILGWISENYPDVVRNIHKNGHEIGCHSFNHGLIHSMDKMSFYTDTEKAIKLLEDNIGEKIIFYRAPGFSITNNTPWAFEVLYKLGIEIDCSVFPSKHDYGGFLDFGECIPARICYNGLEIKEFPINVHNLLNRNIVFSGGGFFRLFPYPIIKKWTKESSYVMSYFHPRDFDSDQPVLPQLSFIRRFKSYYGLKGSFNKFNNWLTDFQTISLLYADKLIDWEKAKIINL